MLSLLAMVLVGRLLGATPCNGRPVALKSLSELAAAADTEQPRNIPIRIEGTVLWSSPAEGRVILHDATATVQLELAVPCEIPALGGQLRLEGECAILKARDVITLSSVPVVENNGLHSLRERSGEGYLEAGKHPIQVDWFNRTDFYGLAVEYEGPDLSRQRIPARALFRSEVDSDSGTTNQVNGLDYRCCEGQWWRQLPNFDHLAAARTGTAADFDVGVRTRDDHVGLQFKGFIEIPRNGDYTFYLSSDDGSRLFIGTPTLNVQAVPGGILPAPQAARGAGASPDDPEFLWSQIEGSIVAMHHFFHSPELELMTESGLVRIRVGRESAGTRTLNLYDRVRAVGVSRRIRNLDGNWVRGEFYVQRLDHMERLDSAAVGAADSQRPMLTSIKQVYQLDSEESALRYPVKVRGVITSPMEEDGAVFQDSFRGIYVALNGPINLQVGDYCEVEGTTGPYTFSHYIEASRVEVLGAGSLPEPVQPSWDQLINGSLHCNYVELEGVVASVSGNIMALLTRGGRINVRLNSTGPAMPPDAIGATVRLRGCLRADWDELTRRVVVGSIFLDQHAVTVVHPAPADPFRVGYKPVGDLLQFDPEAGALQWVRVRGVLVHKGRDFCCLMDGRSGLRFVPVSGIEAEVGDMVDVAGFLELGGVSPVLCEARVRTTEQAELPEPNPLDAADLLRDEHDATYVKVEGVLLGVNRHADRITLELQNDHYRFEAELGGGQDVDALVPGSRLALAGTYVGLGGNRVLGRPIESFKLLLNSGADIAILSQAPWWTLPRMLRLVGLLVAVLVAALVWIKLLRRKVEQRTRELGDQIRERQRAEHQRGIEQERARLAHDLHDDLGAHLTEVNMLAALVDSPFNSDEERKKYADRLSEIALHMVTALDEIVWAVNPRNDTVSSLAGYFGAYAQRLLELASINCGLDVEENLPERALDTLFRREIFLAFKEALSNVVQHAGAEKVWLRIHVEGSDLVVVVADDGSGIVPGKREAGADGLANMEERMAALNGQCVIESVPEAGTTVRLQAPIQENPE